MIAVQEYQAFTPLAGDLPPSYEAMLWLGDLVRAVQELQAQNADLTARIEALEP